MARLSVAERIRYLHDREKFFDVTFVVCHNDQREKVMGHRVIFASSSEPFEAMLYGPLATGDTIEINDVEPLAFKTVKKFIYTDVVEFLSVAHARNVFKVADMYGLVHLSNLAEAYISANLSSNTALRILEFSRGYQKLEMQEKCLNIIRKETAAVLNGDEFLNCDLQFVDLIVSEEKLNLREIELFNFVEKWAVNNMNVEDSPLENEKQLFDEVINKIRFLSMTVDEFTRGPHKSPLLNVDEKYSLLVNICTPGQIPLPDRFCAEKSSRQDAYNSLEATFRYTVNNVSKLEELQLSPPIYVQNLPWRIKVMPRYYLTSDGQARKSLGFFLECNGESESTSWSCYASAELTVLAQKEDCEHLCRKIQHLYYCKEVDWGFSYFMNWEDVLNPEKGYIKDDSIVLEVHLISDEPRGVNV